MATVDCSTTRVPINGVKGDIPRIYPSGTRSNIYGYNLFMKSPGQKILRYLFKRKRTLVRLVTSFTYSRISNYRSIVKDARPVSRCGDCASSSQLTALSIGLQGPRTRSFLSHWRLFNPGDPDHQIAIPYDIQ